MLCAITSPDLTIVDMGCQKLKLLPLLLSPLLAPAQAPDYFPLQLGNQWVYRVSGVAAGSPLVVEVADQQTVGGNVYFVLRGFSNRSLLVRESDDGTLLLYDPAAQQERVWVRFGAAEGESFASAIDPCSAQATLTSRAAHYEGPVGVFDDALEVRYSVHCADAGFERELFLPWVGLARRTEFTLGGPRSYDLIYAELGGVTYVTEPQVSFSLALSVQPSQLTARITLRNTQAVPLPLEFPSSQDFDLVLWNQAGDEVYRWSADKVFLAVIRNTSFSGEKNWAVVIPLADAQGHPFPPGRYVAEANLATSSPDQYVARAAFQIVGGK